MTRVWLDISGIMDRMQSAASEALDEVGDFVAADAKHRAPVRKVFKESPGFRRRFRPLTPVERAIATRRAQNFYTQVRPDEFARRRAIAHIQNYAQVEVKRRGSRNAIGASRKLRILGYRRRGRFVSTSGAFPNRYGGFEPGARLSPMMTARGRYEVRSGRAVHREASARGQIQRIQMGGALKASIGAEGVTQTPTGQQVTVAARIGYAKFVEFPTVRTAAQPFLLPALHDARGRLARTVSRKVSQSLRG